MGDFINNVRRGQVIGPRRRTFTLDGWEQAYEQFPLNDRFDSALYESAKHIHAKLAAIRGAIRQSSLSRLSTETRIKAFIAAVNQQYGVFQQRVRERAADNAERDGSRELQVQDLARTRLTLADGCSYNVEAVLGSMLDGVAIPIRFALKGRTHIAADSFDDVDWSHVQLEMNLGIFYDATENLWEDCVWNTYVIVGARERVVAIPTDTHAKRGFHAAGPRKLALTIGMISFAVRAIRTGERLGFTSRIKEVQSVVTEGEHQSIKFGRNELDPHSLAMLYAMRTMACPAYYDSLLEEPQPLLAGATLSQLFDGWMVVSQAAKCMWDATSSADLPDTPGDLVTASEFLHYVPFFTREALVDALLEAAGIPQVQAEAIIEFLSFRGEADQEFWTQPLVPVGDPSKLYPVFGAIASPPNLRFTLERWMAQLNVDLGERGGPFEQYLRPSLVEAAASSPMLSGVSSVVPRDYTFRCADGAFGQCDAIFCIGETVFVVEAKCILEPTESSTIGTHRSAIEHAVEQARFRVQLIEDHRDEFSTDMKQFGWNLPQTFQVYPLVAVSTVAHVGVPLRGVPVVDEFVLSRFFAGGYEKVGLVGGDFSIRETIFHPFYSSAAEAEEIAASYFKNPPQLQQYSDALQLRPVPLHPVTEDDWSGILMEYDQI